MAKLIVLALLACLAWRLLIGRWPWAYLVHSGQKQAELRARTLLGVDRSATRDGIVEAHRRVIARVHPDRGGSNEQVHAANAARDLLLAQLERK